MKGPQSLNQQRKDVPILFVEGDGLTFDRSEYLSVLREVRLSINVMRILDEMRIESLFDGGIPGFPKGTVPPALRRVVRTAANREKRNPAHA